MNPHKLVALSFKRNLDCYYKDKRIYIFCLIIQVIIFVACLICTAYIFDSARTQAELLLTSRTLRISSRTGNIVNAPEQVRVREVLENNRYVDAQQIVWYFNTSYEDTYIQAIAVSKISALNLSARGSKIDEITNHSNKRVLVVPVFAMPELSYEIANLKENAEVGQTITLGEYEYEVIGVQNFIYTSVHIPLTAGLNDFSIDYIEIYFDTSVNEQTKEKLVEYLRSELKNMVVKAPEPLDTVIISGVSIYLLAGIIACICAVIAFVNMYIFFAKRDQREFLVMCKCGCSKATGKLLLLCQYSTLYTTSYIISVAITQLFLLLTNRSIVSINQIGITYLILYIFLVAIMVFRITSSKHNVVR